MVKPLRRGWRRSIVWVTLILVVIVVGSCRSHPPGPVAVYMLAASDEPPIVVKHGSIDVTLPDWTSTNDGWVADPSGQKKEWTVTSTKNGAKLGMLVVGDHHGCPESGTDLDWVKVNFKYKDGSHPSAVRFTGLDNSHNNKTHIKSGEVDFDFKKKGTGYDPATLSYDDPAMHITGLHLQGVPQPCTFTNIDDSRLIYIFESN